MFEDYPTPWTSDGWRVYDADGNDVAETLGTVSAELIAKVANEYAALVAMLRRVRATCHLSEDETLADDLDALIARAEGRELVKLEEDEDDDEQQSR